MTIIIIMMLTGLIFHFIALAPSAPPSNVKVTVAVFSITLRWEQVECDDRNGNITGYVVHYSVSESNENRTHNLTLNVTNSFTIMTLLPSTTYEIGIAAVNGAGTGDFHNVMSTTMPCKNPSYLCM